MNRIDVLFRRKKANVLSIYFTAGFPERDSTMAVLEALQAAGADMVEIGMPFSDPLADGPVIQQANATALRNGMTIRRLLDDLKRMRERIAIPVVLMGYFNPILRCGVENFCEEAGRIGVDGLIVPDLPLPFYETVHRAAFEAAGLSNILMITPQTSASRIRLIDGSSRGFIYAVSSFGVTGEVMKDPGDCYEPLNGSSLRNPVMIGFGIRDPAGFARACRHAQGAIIGSAYLQAIADTANIAKTTKEFLTPFRSVV